MNIKNYKDWLSIVSRNEYPSILGIGGEEKFLVEESVKTIKKNLFHLNDLIDFNLDVLTAKTSSLQNILACAEIFPLAPSLRRLVIVNDSDFLKIDNDFKNYFKNPNLKTVLFFIFNEFNIANKLQKELLANESLFNFNHPSNDNMINIIQHRVSKFGLNITQDVAEFFQFEIGNNLLFLERALEKISIICEDGLITKKLIEEHIAQIAFHDTFDLIYALILKDKIRAIKSCIELRKQQENPINLIRLIAWKFRIVLKTRLFLDNGADSSDIGFKFRLSGDKLKIVLNAARLITTDLHIERIKYLTKLDKQLKTSRVSSWLIFDSAIMQLCDNY